jgi:imidazoleglycerol phosphate synthase cyclase subunit
LVRPRLIPLLLLKNGLLVRSQGFETHQFIGNPMSTIERFSHWNADEIVILDIGGSKNHDLRRDDLQQQYSGQSILDVLSEIAKVCFMPMAVGGQIRSLQDIEDRLRHGADKCVINTQAFLDQRLVSAAADTFGSQSVVVSIDAKRHADGRYEVFSHNGKVATGISPVEWAARCEETGCGELFLNSIDRDGGGVGFDIELIRQVTRSVKIPVIACGGAGHYKDFSPVILDGEASAVAAANLFHFVELSYPLAKKVTIEAGVPLRPNRIGSRWIKREPVYNTIRENRRIKARIVQSRGIKFSNNQDEELKSNIIWCRQCTYPSLSAVPMEFDENGVCTGCQMAYAKEAISQEVWDKRLEQFCQAIEDGSRRNNSSYDCIIPVSGGKDSYFQVHKIKRELGFNPLLVTYHGNNYTKVGWRNLSRMKEVFDVDHIIIRPPLETLIKLNRLGFIVMGDMNWHAHMGITTVPVQIAAENNISTLIWGEHGYTDLSGQFSMNDFPEMSYRDRLEHFGRGYEWNYFVGREGLTSEDMKYWKYPNDQKLAEVGIRGLYLGNYVYWEANEHTKRMIDEYGFEISNKPFDRTYRFASNLDDMHENGVHDYLKYIKFGYGRCTDHTCKDIRSGRMLRNEAIKLIEQFDSVKPSDLSRWLAYVGMDEEDFDRIADTFRDPRVWAFKNGEWQKKKLQ